MALKIKLTNKTVYKTGDLKKLVRVCVIHHADESGSWNVDVLTKRNWTRRLGQAYVNSRWFSLRVSKEGYDLKQLISTTLHEIDHCYGLRHKDMEGGRYIKDERNNTIVDEVLEKLGPDFVIRRKPEPKRIVREKGDKTEKDLEKARKRLEKAERDFKASEARLERWRKRVKKLEYYKQWKAKRHLTLVAASKENT